MELLIVAMIAFAVGCLVTAHFDKENAQETERARLEQEWERGFDTGFRWAKSGLEGSPYEDKWTEEGR
jgi:hypothetical protein